MKSVLLRASISRVWATTMDEESAVDTAFEGLREYKPNGPVRSFRTESYDIARGGVVFIWGEETPSFDPASLFGKTGLYVEINGVVVVDTVEEDDVPF